MSSISAGLKFTGVSVGMVSASTALPDPASGSLLNGLVLDRIRAVTPSLSRTGRQVGQVITADPSRVVELTVSDLAAESNTSVGSVVRFCQDLGLRGFGDLKLRLAAETASHPNAVPEHSDSTAGILDGVLRASAEALSAAAGNVDPEPFSKAVDAVANAEHLLVVGVGTSAPLAQDAAYRLRSIGLLAEAAPDVHVQHVSAALMRPDSVCLAISHTGQTRETLAAVAAACEAGATTIAVTSFYRSPLTGLCDHALVAGSRETRYQVEARASRLVHSALLDALHAAITHAQPERASRSSDRAAHVVADHRF